MTQTGNIAIGTNNAVLSGTNQIFIGASNKTTNISGSAINMSGSTINISGILNICTTGGNTTIGNNTAGATNILGQVNIANDGLPTSGGVNIATNGFGTSSYITIGSATFPQIYMRSVNTRINDNGGNTNIGNGTGTTSFYGTIKMGNNSATFKNITHYVINQVASYDNVYRFINFGGITFTSIPCVTVTAIFDYSGYVGYAQVRNITTSGFYYSLVLQSTSFFAMFYAGDPHILCYTAIGT